MEKNLNPPFSNTGVPIYNDRINDYKYGSFEVEKKVSYSIDWLRVTTGKIEYDEDHEVKNTSIPLINGLLRVLKSPFNYFDLRIEKGGLTYGETRMVVCNGITIYFYGSINKKGEILTVIDISGTGCDRFNSLNDWYELIKYLKEDLNCNCTRLDCAVDDYFGEDITYKEFFDLLSDGFYTRMGSPKKIPLWHREGNKNYDAGCTVDLYRGGDIELCCYNKMAEQYDECNPLPNSPQWLRHELRFKNKQGDIQLNVFYGCILYELIGEINDNACAFSKYVSGALYEALKLYTPTKDTNKARWEEHPGWKRFIGDISSVKFVRPKTKTDNILKTKVYFEDSYSRFLLKMYLTFGKEYFYIWLDDFMFHNRKKIEPSDIVNVNELRNALNEPILSLNEIVVKMSSLEVLDSNKKLILNKYDLPTMQQVKDIELNRQVDKDIISVFNYNEDYSEFKEKIKKQIKKLQALIGDDLDE